MKIKDSFEILKPYDFLYDLKKEAKMAKKRIWIQAMYIRPGVVASTLVDIFRNSSKQKVTKKLHVDWYDLMLSNHKRQTREKEMLDDLQNMNVKILLTNPPDLIEKMWPFKGRNHMKIAIVDDISYIGGLNFSDEDFGYIDFMVKIKNPAITEAVADQFSKIENNRLVDDKIQIDKETILLVDSGKVNQSIILDHATELAYGANKNVFHINQILPDGKFLKALHKAYKKGGNVEVVVPSKIPSKMFYFIHKINDVEMLLKRQQVPILSSPETIHAKLTIFDERTVLFGSHNLSQKGVCMGTAEIFLQSTNQKLVQDFLHFYNNLST